MQACFAAWDVAELIREKTAGKDCGPPLNIRAGRSRAVMGSKS